MSYIVFQYTVPCQGRPPTEHTARSSRGMCFDCYIAQMVGLEGEDTLLAVFPSASRGLDPFNVLFGLSVLTRCSR